ncbi:MAG: cytochrome c oxidase subunit 3 [Cyclobacteriaceae bacterium]|nr:cytochrome c oxidase subunit 3 [Cyclobacteriaceae bacterium]UYN85895.1 MAG: cytochrome c oxidase subunit 3 [Cyclobacteriaceae bacterium]
MSAEIKELKIVEEAKKPLSMNPKKFALWLFMMSVIMLFGAWTSAYLVKRADAGWAEIILPSQFWVNSVIVVLSSITMIWAYFAAKRDNIDQLKIALLLTAILGSAFLAGQYLAYGEMVALKQHLTGSNVSHSFLWILPGVHGLHIVSGLVFIVIVLVNTYKFKVHSKGLDQLEMCATYWHFLGGLWLYLFIFLILNP